MIKVAMIGAGGYAYELIKRIWQIPDVLQLVAVSSNPSRKSAGRSACLEKGVEVLPTVDELLDRVAGIADVIIIPTPINTHSSLARKCLEAGFDVWLEKPPVATIQELDSLHRYVQTQNRNLAVLFQHLYSKLVQKLKAEIVAGTYGPVKRVKGMAGWQRLDEYYTRSNWAGKLRVNGDWVLDGTINNPLSHMLANQLYFASMEPNKMAEPITIQAELYHGHTIESEDTSSLRIETSNGVEILFNASLCSQSFTGPIITIECEDATIEYTGFNEAVVTRNNGEMQKFIDKSEQRIHMLRQLSHCYENNEPYLITLETCRPFTIAVNGAFESCGTVYPVEEKYIHRFEHGDSIKTVITGIDNLLQTAHENMKLFSEVGTPWSKSSKILDLNGYKEFPSKGFVCP